jgi:virulence factor Mce-like protein
METRAPTYRQLIVPIGFALASVGLAIVVWLSFGGSAPLAPQDYRVTMRLPDASDVYPGSDVDISGVKIGRVISMSEDGGAAKVWLQLQPRYAPLRTGATAIKRTKSLLGEGYIEIAPGPRNARPIPDGGELAASHVLKAQSLDDVLGTFAPHTRQDLRHLFGGLAAAFAGRAQSLSDSLGYAAPTSENLSTVFDQLASQQRNLGQLFSRSDDVLVAMAGRQADLQAAVTAGEQVLSATARSSSSLSDTLRDLPPFLIELRSASQTITGAATDLNGAVSALEPIAPKLNPALQAIDVAAPQFRALFSALPGLIAAGDRGLPAATSIIRAAGSSFATVYPVARQLIPTLQLLAALRGSLNSFFANIGQFTNGTVSGTNGATQTAIEGIPSVWNETLVGWKIRLPSNRPNAYPKPGAGAEIGNGGLQSYDCRQLGNPLFIPPTGGTGATPCRLQGPWTFNGVSRYYPHLTVASP